MPYTTGIVNDMASIRSAIVNTLTAKGWTLTGATLSKGACNALLAVEGAALTLRLGRSVDPDKGKLLNPSPNKAYIREIGNVGLVWPVTYELFYFDDPIEVYAVINYAVDCYLWLAFGVATSTGTRGGAWAGGNTGAVGDNPAPGPPRGTTIGVRDAGADFSNDGSTGTWFTPAGLFWQNYANEQDWRRPSFIDVGDAWVAPNAVNPIDTLITRQPNVWNGETVPIPIQPYRQLPETKVAMVADLKNARYMRITNYTPGQIITLGPDRWKVFPFFRKNASSADQSNSAQDTGTFGWMIRYDGP
ncbi:MAG: hypothetical protein GAK28_00688 [Luteibacter sp.]|uniref:hypothetical protein n=1 Tax=Luteibacter sp. TaxID=1886636 RepID=UPI0013817CBF|nr:hypothetical protein [Luteibacter sp.]KAF1009055.1 MAG: hypothetical protein GAK28_00688 [Luteibacter sp.]